MFLKKLGLALSLMLLSTLGLAADEIFTATQQNQIRQIVHDYLIKNPGVLVEASQALQQQEEKDMQKRAVAAIPGLAPDLFRSQISPSLGDPNSKVAIVEFFDYQCSHCKNMAPELTALLKANKNIRIIYKQLPIFGPNSVYAARAALASTKQGSAKFLVFHDALMKAENPLTQGAVLKAAQEVGLELNKLQADLSDTKFDQEFKTNNALASALGVVGTPAIVVANNIDAQNHNLKAVFINGETNQATLQQTLNTLTQ